ncbi:unnamed protein product [Thelazia callipaeda]|uniref:lysozyme n=1 Tax=Thelazia callipaeda TaxID=103827 RepID=A0A0N5CL50_THECL|nr:unnamed protein product [Thelazia callipaeda]
MFGRAGSPFLKFSVESLNDCMQAIWEADYGCVQKSCNKDIHGRYGCGYFQLNIYHYKLCYQPGKKEDQDEEEAWPECAENFKCSQEFLGETDECETLTRIYDGGANGCCSKNTLSYWKTVKQICPHC